MPICCMTLVNKDNKRFFLSTTFVLCLMVLFSYGELAFQWELNRSISTRFNPIFELGRIHTLLFILYHRNYLHDKIKCISSSISFIHNLQVLLFLLVLLYQTEIFTL